MTMPKGETRNEEETGMGMDMYVRMRRTTTIASKYAPHIDWTLDEPALVGEEIETPNALSGENVSFFYEEKIETYEVEEYRKNWELLEKFTNALGEEIGDKCYAKCEFYGGYGVDQLRKAGLDRYAFMLEKAIERENAEGGTGRWSLVVVADW